MRTFGGTMFASLLVVVIAFGVIKLTDSTWLHVVAWIAIALALYTAARAMFEAAGRVARAALKIAATGGFAVLYPDLKVRSHRPPAGTWRNVLYTGGLGLLDTRNQRKTETWTPS
ncbi:MAG: hypothetical protein ACRDNB_10345 [Gaiellaceae bacterium]